MKALKVLYILCAVVLVFCIVGISVISSTMQDYYKGQMDGTASNAETEELLNKKQVWVRIGESPVWEYVSYAALFIMIVSGTVSIFRKQVQ